MWKNYLLLMLQLAPAIVSGVESIRKEAPGATKKQLATDSLHLAAATALAVDPKDEQLIQLSNAFAGTIIDATVKDKNDAGEFAHAAAHN